MPTKFKKKKMFFFSIYIINRLKTVFPCYTIEILFRPFSQIKNK